MQVDCYLEHMAQSKSYNDADRAWSVLVYTQKWLLMRTSSVAYGTVKHYGVTINKAKGWWTILLLVELLCFMCYKPDTYKWASLQKNLDLSSAFKSIGMLNGISSEELILICLCLTYTANTLGY